MPKINQARVNVNKLTIMTIVLNGFQIGAAVCLALMAMFGAALMSDILIKLALCALTLVVCWGAAIDIREAFQARRLGEQTDMLQDSLDNLETLNGEMRKQRHDFMNHLQVVYSLVEMGDNKETCDYIERVYGDLRRVGKVLKTALPSVNALIAAKQNDAEARGVQMVTDVRSAWETMPIQGWEMCRVLGNLIDNAFDALSAAPHPRVTVFIYEDVHACLLAVENNGPAIPQSIRARIFEERFSTKGRERGMGLAIVREIVEGAGGTICVSSDELRTRFELSVPKRALQVQTEG